MKVLLAVLSIKAWIVTIDWVLAFTPISIGWAVDYYDYQSVRIHLFTSGSIMAGVTIISCFWLSRYAYAKPNPFMSAFLWGAVFIFYAMVGSNLVIFELIPTDEFSL